jgi:hypothetical protein
MHATVALGVLILIVHSVFSSNAVTINPTDNAATIVQANPAGTVYTIAAGTHRGFTVTPKSNDVYLSLHPSSIFSHL